MKKLGIILILLLLIDVAAGILLAQGGLPAGSGMMNRGAGSIEVIGEGSPDQKTMSDVQQAAEAFNDVLQEQMGVKLKRSIKVYVAASEPVYEKVLKREFDLKTGEAKNVANISGGWSGGRRAITAINGKAGVMSDASDRWSTTAHELFHQVQYELSKGNDTDERALFWLEEGSADYMGAVFAEKLGGKNQEKWVLDTKVDLMGAPRAVQPEKLQHNTLEQREALMTQELHSYQMADLMTWYLLEHYAKGQEGGKLVEYFQQLGRERQGEVAFKDTFGVSLEAFLAEFDTWWNQEKARTADLHFIARKGVSDTVVQSLIQQAGLTQQLFRSRFGQELHGEYQIVLAADQQDLMAALKEYCGVPEDRAKELSGYSLWLDNGSTILVNVGQMGENRQRVFCMGVMLMRIMQTQRKGQPEHDIEWLIRGAGYVMGVARLGEIGLGSLADYQRSWKDTLKKEASLPQLSQMVTADGFHQVAEQHSDDTASILAEYATAELVNRFGWRSLVDWQEAARSSGDGQKAFQETFGLRLNDFEAQVQAKIKYTR